MQTPMFIVKKRDQNCSELRSTLKNYMLEIYSYNDEGNKNEGLHWRKKMKEAYFHEATNLGLNHEEATWLAIEAISIFINYNQEEFHEFMKATP